MDFELTVLELEVPKVVRMRINVFWNIMLSSPLKANGHAVTIFRVEEYTKQKASMNEAGWKQTCASSQMSSDFSGLNSVISKKIAPFIYELCHICLSSKDLVFISQVCLHISEGCRDRSENFVVCYLSLGLWHH